MVGTYARTEVRDWQFSTKLIQEPRRLLENEGLAVSNCIKAAAPGFVLADSFAHQSRNSN